VRVTVKEVIGARSEWAGIRCWREPGKAVLLIRVGTPCETVSAELRSGNVVDVFKLWPGDEGCRPLFCVETVPPRHYRVEVTLGDDEGVVFRVLRAIECGGKGVEVTGLVGECVPAPQPQTPR